MIRLISDRKAEKILERHSSWIGDIAGKYNMPAALIRAVLYQEMTAIDLVDVLADLAVFTQLFRKKDSSTGYAQIYGYVGLNALNDAVARGLASYADVGIETDRPLDPSNRKDVHRVWKRLYLDPAVNMEIAAQNLLVCAREMTGRLDFPSYTENEIKLILTRYNANVRRVTKYGEAAYQHYLRYKAMEEAGSI